MSLIGETVRAHKSLVALFLVSLLGLSLCQGAFVFGTKGLMRALFDQGNVSTLFIRDLIPLKLNLAESSGPVSTSIGSLLNREVSTRALSWLVPLYLLLVGVGQATSNYFYQVSQQRLGLYAASFYREKLFSAIVKLPFLEVHLRSPGQWMSIVMNDVVHLQNRMTELSTALFKDSILIVVSIGLLWVIHWPSALVISSCIPVMAWSMGRAGKRVTQYAEGFQRALGKIAAAVHDMRQRFDFVYGQKGQQRENDFFSMLADQYFQTMRRSLWIRAFMVSSLEWIGFVFFAGLLFLVGQRLVLAFDGETLIQLMVALGLLMRPVKELGEQIARYHETKGILKSSLEVFHQVETLAALAKTTVKETRLREVSHSGLLVAQIRVTIDQKLLFTTRDLSLTPGQTIAVIGPSGAGKSTFIKSLAGLIAPSTWDATMEWQEFVGQVSFVSQDPFFFHDSIRNNLVYGALGEGTLTDQDLWEALGEVGLEVEVRDFDQQLDTAVFAFTHNVSGGQLQRLVIARAILRKRRFLLLDEATSAIDAVAEGMLIKKLIQKSRTHKINLFMITHRLQWLDLFDRVLFVEFGRITHSGPHEQLLKLPRYQQYCQAESDAYTHQ